MGIHRLDIRGIEVLFPFKPYNCQVNYMDKVIQCLNESLEDRDTNGRDVCRRNALLESPTGTGKTMCLLCASYAWLIHVRQKYAGVRSFPKIIFASRTHSQLAQAIRELKQSPYSPEICILGSREQTCIHPHVGKMSGTLQNRECISRVATHTCEFYEHYQQMKRDGTIYNVFDHHQQQQQQFQENDQPTTNNQHHAFVPDIEDLVLEGTKQQFCPFFYSREVMQMKAEIVFMPYNYLIDPRVRKQTGVDISDSILIFDEAHNLEKWCSDASSFDLPTICIAQSVAELERIIRDMRNNSSPQLLTNSRMNEEDKATCLTSDLEKLKNDLLDLDIFLDDLKIDNVTKTGDYLFDILSEANIKPSTYDEFHMKMKFAINYLENTEQGKKLHLRPTGLRNLHEVLGKIFDCGLTDEEFKLYFKIHIEVKYDSRRSMAQESLEVLNEELANRERQPKNLRYAKTICLWCFNPGLAMQSIKSHKPQCFILTSGTLSPMDSFAYELGLAFPIRLENPHVIKQDQITLLTASVGPTNIRLNGSFTKQSDEYFLEIGRLLVNMSRIVPDGLLVFFPSSSMLHKCLEIWKRPVEGFTCVYDAIANYKKVFTEPSDGSQLQTVMTGYSNAINESENTTGAIFLAVCRGRVSEGLDFSGRNGRCVVIVGMPFPPLKDPKVVLKRQYLDTVSSKRKQELLEKGKRDQGKLYDGNEWYQQESSRAVNQAVGRVIRNKFDYGAVILCDERYSSRQSREQLSRWLQKHVTVTKNFGEIVQHISQFYKRSLTEFGINSEKLKAKFLESMKRDDQEMAMVNIMLPPPATSRINLTNTININPSYHSQDEHHEEDNQSAPTTNEANSKLTTHVQAQQYHYIPKDIPKPLFSRKSPTISLSNQVSSGATTPVILNTNASSPGMTPRDQTAQQQQQQQQPQNNVNLASVGGNNNSPSSRQVNSKQSQKKSSASLFIEEAKKKLTDQEYKEFKQILQNFQKMFTAKKGSSVDQFNVVIAQILRIFTGEKASLLVGLREFIPANVRTQYDTMTKSASDGVTTNRASTSGSTSGSKSSPPQQQVAGQKRKREEYYDLVSGQKMKRPDLLSHPIRTTNITTVSDEPITIDDDDDQVADDIPLTLDTMGSSTSGNSSTVASLAPPATNNTPSSSTDSNNIAEEKDASGIRCKVCYEVKQDLANSRCGHVLCMDCWNQCLQVKLECPICRERVRLKQLTKIFL